jgi:hypothetical protein
MLQTALATGATLVSLAFALSTFERWLERRRRHELGWSVALLQFSLASAALAAGAGLGWNATWFRLFYLFGAITNVPFLALGTVYLLGGERRGDVWAAIVTVAAAFAGGVVAVSPLTGPIPRDALPQGSEVFDALPRVMAAVASGAGATVVIAGALWSAWRFRRGRMLWANVLIATGTAITGMSGLLNSVMDEMDAFAVTLTAGITVIFVGFLVAASEPPAQRNARRNAFPPALRGISSTTSTRAGAL